MTEEEVRPTETLTGPDSAIYNLLQRVIAIGRWNGAWKEVDVARVAFRLHGGGELSRKSLIASRKRLIEMEQENEKLHEKIHHLKELLTQKDGLTAERVVMVTQLRAEVMELACSGKTTAAIAQTLGMSVPAVARHITRTTKQIGVQSSKQAIAMINRGQVGLVVKIESVG